MKILSKYQLLVLGFFFGASFLLNSCNSSNSSIATSPPPPPPPEVVSMGISAVSGDRTVTIAWSNVSSSVYYDVYSSVSSTDKGSKIASPSGTSYTDSSVTNGTTYYYVIEAFNAEGMVGTSSQVSATPDVAGGSVTISGKIQYQDKEYGVNGFTGNMPYKFVRHAAVELVSGNSVLLSAMTDSRGFYSMTTSPTSTVYIRVKTTATPPGSGVAVEVKNLSGGMYAAGGNDFFLSGPANVNISISASSIGGAFNILDVFANGFEFVNNLSTYPTVTLSGFWQQNSSEGTYYCTGCPSPGDGIYVFSIVGGDTDEYDDDVLYHEFGHYAADHFSWDDSPGGPHRLTNDDLDMRLAWSEGWGDAFPGFIKMWLYANYPELLSTPTGLSLTEYIDTSGSQAQIAIDMGAPDGTYKGSYLFACSEIAIAKILLDVNKSFGMPDIWSVFEDFKANPPAGPVNLELFWDRWHSLPGTVSKNIDSMFTGRSIFYSPDSSEPDNDLMSASTYTPNVTGLQLGTLYADTDNDIVSFSVGNGQHYTISTLNLKNGADTYITLLNPQGIVMDTRDNTNGSVYSGSLVPSDIQANRGLICDFWGICHDNGYDILGTSLSFIASSGGTYYANIQSSPSRPLSAGRYGSYTLRITSP